MSPAHLLSHRYFLLINLNLSTHPKFLTAMLINMGNCTDCKAFINKTELSLFWESSSKASTPSSQQVDKSYSCFTPVLSNLIASWRGYTERKQFSHIYKLRRPEHPYFSIDEVQETVSKVLGKAKFKETRKECRLKHGRYTGQWCGGFRQGYGVMEYNDGSRYEGQWLYSRPSGSGKFIYKTGEGYQGDWKVYFIFNKAIFKTGRLDQWKDCVQDGYRNH